MSNQKAEGFGTVVSWAFVIRHCQFAVSAYCN
jgi:hypothetical protein